MKLNLNQIDKAPKIKTPISSINSHRAQPINISFNPESTPIKFNTQKFEKQIQQNLDQFIKSPFQTEKFLSNTATSKQKPVTQSKDNFNLPGSMNFFSMQLLNQKRKSYTEYNNMEDSHQSLKSSPAFELRQTLTYVEQILSDLSDKGNYGLAKRYVKKLNEINIKRQIEKLIFKMEEKDSHEAKQLHKIRQALAKILIDRTNFNCQGNWENLPTEQLLKQVQAAIIKASKHIKQQNTRQNENNLIVRQLQKEINNIKEQYGLTQRQNREENFKIRKQLEKKTQNFEKEIRQNINLKAKYQNMLSNMSQQQKTLKTQYEKLKGQNFKLTTINEQLTKQIAQFSINSQLQNIAVCNLRTQLNNMRAINQKFISQAIKLQSLNLKFKKYSKNQLNAKRFQQKIQKQQCKNLVGQKQLEKIKNDREELQQLIFFLQQNLNFITNQIELKRTQCNKLSVNNQTLQNQIQINEGKRKYYQQELQKNNEQFQQYQKQLRQIRIVVEGYIKVEQNTNSHIKSLNAVVQHLESIVLQKKTMIRDIQITINEAYQKSRFIEKECNSKQSQIKSKNKQLEILVSKILQNEKLLLDGQTKRQEKKNNLLNQQIRAQECKKYELRLSKLMKSCKSSSDLLDQIQLQTIKHSQLKDTLLKEEKILNNQITNNKRKILDLKAQQHNINNQVKNQQNNLRKIINQIQQKRNQLQKQQASLSCNLLRVSQLNQQIDTKTNTINELKEMESFTIIRIQQLKGQLAQYQQKCKQLKSYKDQASQLYHTKQLLFKQILEKHEIILAQNTEIKENQQLFIRFEVLLSGVAELQQQSQKLQISMNHNIMLIDKQSEQLLKLKQQSECVEMELTKKKKQLQANFAFVQQSLISIQKLSQHMNFWQKEVQKLQKQEEQLSFEVLNRQKQIIILQNQIQKSTNQQHLRHQKLEQLQLLYHTTKKQYKQLKQNVRKQKNAHNKIKRSLMTTACEEDTQKFSQNLIKDKDDIIKEELDNLHARKGNIQNQIFHLNQVLVVLQTDIWLKQNQLHSQPSIKQTQSNSFLKHVSHSLNNY